MSDYIDSLPTDDSPLNSQEKTVMDTIFKGDSVQMFIYDLKIPLIAGILFIILNLEMINKFLRDIIPYSRKSELSLLCVKTLIFVVLIFMFSNYRYILRY